MPAPAFDQLRAGDIAVSRFKSIYINRSKPARHEWRQKVLHSRVISEVEFPRWIQFIGVQVSSNAALLGAKENPYRQFFRRRLPCSVQKRMSLILS